jgi:hypothetical protein
VFDSEGDFCMTDTEEMKKIEEAPEYLIRCEHIRGWIAGCVVKHDKIISAAPILKLDVGGSWQRAEQILRKRGWRIVPESTVT